MCTTRNAWENIGIKTDVATAGDKHQRLTLTCFVFAVAHAISLWVVTIFDSCYVLSMETSLLLCHISSTAQ